MEIIDKRSEDKEIKYGDVVCDSKRIGIVTVSKHKLDSAVYELKTGQLLGRYVSSKDMYNNDWRKVRATLTIE